MTKAQSVIFAIAITAPAFALWLAIIRKEKS